MMHRQQWDISGPTGKRQCCDGAGSSGILLHLLAVSSVMMHRQQRGIAAPAGSKQCYDAQTTAWYCCTCWQQAVLLCTDNSEVLLHLLAASSVIMHGQQRGIAVPAGSKQCCDAQTTARYSCTCWQQAVLQCTDNSGMFLRMLAINNTLVANITATYPELRCNEESVTLRAN
jgi:hypothetical protein